MSSQSAQTSVSLVPVCSAESSLSAHEYEVARMVAQGATNQEIAHALFLSHGTVKNHISAVLRKMGLRDRTQLAIALRDK